VDNVSDVASVAEPLQLVDVEPGVGEVGQDFDVRVDGAGFGDGLRVGVVDAAGGVTELLHQSVVDGNTVRGRVPGLAAGRYDVQAVQGTSRAVLRQGISVRTSAPDTQRCSRVTVRFETDDATLAADSRKQLDSLADCFNTLAAIRIEGHADERGTTSYNLGLGQRRAHTVSRYLVGLGVPLTQQELISYGEEHPIADGHDDAAWASNRRVELLGR